ncbi:thiosulfate:glutathione sulfurtransferase-like [Oratosquilla oratoria]|uniref:thiosulfate:glutathione sulfurtransferase-like n=1 Tax=Oratosquilla oratoria TaxID=337810 RepID=UPI003F757756
MFGLISGQVVPRLAKLTWAGQLVGVRILGSSQRFISSVNLPNVEFKELQQQLEDKEVVLIDVRTRGERSNPGHIPGSVNLPLHLIGDALLMAPETFQEKFGFVKPDEKEPIVTMCLLGIRSRTAQLAFMGAGYTNVRNYLGSFDDWLERGGTVISAAEEEETS